MSAIAGVVRVDDGRVDPDVVERMAARIARRGYDISTIVEPNAAVIFGAVGADLLPQPLCDSTTGALIVFDGRLDNRDELVAQLAVEKHFTDAALTLAAYRRWGEAFAERLLGDFAIAIADRGARSLVCARDPLGNRRLHYRIGPGWVAFASSIDSLVAAIEPMPAINEGLVAEYLATYVVSDTETLYEGVSRLPAAHVLVASDAGQRTRCYWTPSPPVLRYTRDEQYDEHLRDLLTRGVAACLRTSAPAGVMLSGGLDSSSVTGIAATLIRDRAVAAPSLEALSIAVPESPTSEHPYFGAVSDRWGLRANAVQQTAARPGQFRDEITLDLEPQVFPHSPTLDLLRGLARARGIRVVLTGFGGDDWLSSGPSAYADLLRHGRLLALARRLYLDRGEDPFPGWPFALQSTIWPLLPNPVQAAARRLLNRGQAPPWIDKAFAARTALVDRMAPQRSPRLFATLEQDANWFGTTNGGRMFVNENVTRGADRFGLDLAHPLFDRRLVEFTLALPADQLWRDGRSKPLLRRATRDVVPEVVSSRRLSPPADDVFLDALASEVGATPFTGLEIERRGWIDGGVARAMFASLSSASPARVAQVSRLLWGLQAIDLWLGARSMVKYPDSPRRLPRD